MLEDVLKNYKDVASLVNWKKLNRNQLFFEYIKHEHEPIAENYYAGIVCKCWGYAGRLYSQCNQHVPFEDCYETLLDTINYVLQKRVWENPESSLYGDTSAPDKAFHIVLKRQRGILLAKLTADKRQANFNTLSIDGAHEEYADAADGLLDIGDESSEMDINDINLVSFIRTKDPLSILFLDQICFGNWSSLKNIITNTKKVSKSDFYYYNSTYNLDEKKFTKALKEVIITSNNQLMSELKKLLYIVKEEYYGQIG